MQTSLSAIYHSDLYISLRKHIFHIGEKIVLVFFCSISLVFLLNLLLHKSHI
jgi:hypothetical protein